MFDLYDERNFFFYFGYGVIGGYKFGRVIDVVVDVGVKINFFWIDKDKVNDVWGIELWYFD